MKPLRRLRPVWGPLRARAATKMLAGAIDVTDETSSRSCLVLAPHPDDETIACGATIARKVDAGVDVRVVIATDGRYSHRSQMVSADELAAIREAEARLACERLGLPTHAVTFLRFEDRSLGSHMTELTDALRTALDWGPDEVLVCAAGDGHLDHVALNRAVASIGVTSRSYPVWYWERLPWVARPARVEVVRTDRFLPRKRWALEAYRSQLENLTGERRWATIPPRFLARFTGAQEVFFGDSRVAGRSRAAVS